VSFSSDTGPVQCGNCAHRIRTASEKLVWCDVHLERHIETHQCDQFTPLSQKDRPFEGRRFDSLSSQEREQLGQRVKLLLHFGTPPEAMLNDFTELGFDADSAATLTKELGATHRAGEAVAGKKNMIVGGVIASIGLLIMAATFASSEETGWYFVPRGAIAWGAIQFLMGVGAWRRSRSGAT